MCKADEGEDGHAAVEDAEAVGSFLHGVGNDDAEAYTEQDGEDGVELSVDKHIEKEAHEAVDLRRGKALQRLVSLECPERELREISQDDAKEGEAAQRIEHYEAMFYGSDGVVLHSFVLGVMEGISLILRLKAMLSSAQSIALRCLKHSFVLPKA